MTWPPPPRTAGHPTARATRAAALLVACVFSTAACQERAGEAAAGASNATASRPLLVFAASSLKDVFATPAIRGADARTVTFNFAGTQELRTQLEHGASADVFVSADTKHLDTLHAEQLVDAPSIFTCNHLVVVVPKGNPLGLTGWKDLDRVPRIVLASADVPAGRYAGEALRRASALYGADFDQRVNAHVVSREFNVRLVLGKVELGEADAAIVYRTDARAAGDRVVAFDVPKEADVLAQYAIAQVTKSANPEGAAAFIARVKGTDGQRALAEAGFSPCDGAPTP